MKILLATDGSRHSEKALETAASFSFPSGSSITIVTVAENSIPLTLDLYGTGFIPSDAKLIKIARDNALTILENSRKGNSAQTHQNYQ